MRKTSIRDVVAHNITAALEKGQMSGNKLAAAAGVSQTHLAKVLRGEAAFSTDKLAEVAKGLGLEPWELLVDAEAVRERAIRRMLTPPAEHYPKKVMAGRNPPSPRKSN